ncbi:hypothetical protein CsSME_00005678 [Camellia sinensis var. sinensis]
MWHEARRSEKKVHDMMDAARKRAQRRAVYLAKRRGDPQQSIQVLGSRSRMYRDDGLYQATQDQQGLYVYVSLNQFRAPFVFFLSLSLFLHCSYCFFIWGCLVSRKIFQNNVRPPSQIVFQSSLLRQKIYLQN